MTLVPADDERQAAVRTAFADWAARQAGAPREVASLLQGIDVSHEHLGLLATEVHGRRVVWNEVPIGGRVRVTAPAMTPESIDAWDVEQRSLRERSEYVAICAGCGGEGKMRCGGCGGAGKLLCGACHGQRKAYGYAANGSRRLLNCKECNGKGQVDCGECRRGIATCARCAGEGRLQRWIELECWRRATAGAYRAALAQQLGWEESPSDARIASDADRLADIDRPHRLTAADLGSVSEDWLRLLGPPLEPGERVARQRLRVASVPQYTARYRLGSTEDNVVFAGHGLTAPPDGAYSAFAQRASRLGVFAWLLIAIAVGTTIVALTRGAFYRNVLTFISLGSIGIMLAMLYGAATDWTAARRNVRRWLVAAASCLVVAITLTIAAFPRRAHAERLLRDGQLEAAAEELGALNAADVAPLWADLGLARIRAATDIAAGQKALVQIPESAPQHAAAVIAMDDLLLRSAVTAMQQKRLKDAAAALTQLSDGAARQPDVVAAALSVFPPLARQKMAQKDWSGAAEHLVAARRLGVASSDLQPLIDSIHTAGIDAAARAKQISDARRRLLARQKAEQILVAWEKAADRWGTPALLSLRTAMARDVAAAEKSARRRR